MYTYVLTLNARTHVPMFSLKEEEALHRMVFMFLPDYLLLQVWLCLPWSVLHSSNLSLDPTTKSIFHRSAIYLRVIAIHMLAWRRSIK